MVTSRAPRYGPREPPRRASSRHPGEDSMVSRPPTSPTRSRMPAIPSDPRPHPSGSNPLPSSSTTTTADAAFAHKGDADVSGGCVLDDVRQRLLHDPVEDRLGLGRGVFTEARRDVDGRPRGRRDGRREPLDRGYEPEVVERARPGSTARRRTSWSVATTRSRRSAASARASSLSTASSSWPSPRRIDASAWPVSSWSSRASRARSSSRASTTRRRESRPTRSERSTAIAARDTSDSAKRTSASSKRGSAASLS